jgi:hypothetical protein
MKTYGGVVVQIRVLFSSEIVGGEWLAFCPRGGWMGPRTGLDDVERKKILPLPELEV